MEDYFKILEIPRNASEKQIKEAYKRLAKKYHPDKNPTNKKAEEQFKRINTAYQILSVPSLRAEHLSKLAWQPPPDSWYRSANHSAGVPFTVHQSNSEDFTQQGKHYKAPSFQQRNKDKDFYYIGFTLFVIISCVMLLLGRFMNQMAAKQHVEKAMHFLSLKEYSKAKLEAEYALEFDENYAQPYFIIAQYYASRNECDVAHAYLNKAVMLGDSEIDSKEKSLVQINCP